MKISFSVNPCHRYTLYLYHLIYIITGWKTREKRKDTYCLIFDYPTLTIKGKSKMVLLASRHVWKIVGVEEAWWNNKREWRIMIQARDD